MNCVYDVVGAEVIREDEAERADELSGSTAEIRFGDAFPGVESLNVTLLTDTDQRSQNVEAGIGSVDL